MIMRRRCFLLRTALWALVLFYYETDSFRHLSSRLAPTTTSSLELSALRKRKLPQPPQPPQPPTVSEPSAVSVGLSEPDEQALIQQKLSEWSKLKELGILQKLNSSTIMDDESMEAFEAMADKALGRKRILRPRNLIEKDRKSSKPEVVAAVLSPADKSMLYDMEKKLDAGRNSVQNLFDLLLEIRDKNVVAQQNDIIVRAIEALSRLKSDKYMETAVKYLLQWQASGKISVQDSNKYFSKLVRSIGTNKSMKVTEAIVNLLRNEGLLSKEDGDIAILLNALANFTQTDTNSTETLKMLENVMATVDNFAIDAVNDLLRLLGRNGYITECFRLFDAIKGSKRLRPNGETVEYLVNSIITPQVTEATATTMKDLPAMNNSMQEVILLGKSNVGKSSLTNFLLNRKVSVVCLYVILTGNVT